MEKSSLILNAHRRISYLPACPYGFTSSLYLYIIGNNWFQLSTKRIYVLLIILAFLWCFLRLKKSSLSEKARSWESSAVKHQILYLYLICILCQNLRKGKMAWQIALFLISFFLFSFIFGRMLHFGHLFFSFLILQPNT